MLSRENDQTEVSDSESKSLANAGVRFSAASWVTAATFPCTLKLTIKTVITNFQQDMPYVAF